MVITNLCSQGILNFFCIADKSIWQDIFLSSLFIPADWFIFKKTGNWWSDHRPAHALLKEYRNLNVEVFIFLSQLSGTDNNYAKNPNQKFVTQFPKPLATNVNNLGHIINKNIDPVWSEADGLCATDIFNVLGRVGKTNNVRIANLINDWGRRANPIFTVGFNPKTRDLIQECYPIYFEGYDNAYLRIKNDYKKLDCITPNDAGVIQKTFIKNTKIPVFILAGLGTVGPSVPGNFLSRHFQELGKVYGNKPFCILLKTDITKGPTY